VLTSTAQERQLLPRYRRLLTFGDVLDESIQLFRQHWVSFAVLSAFALLPPGLVGVWLSASGAFSRTISVAELQTGRLAQTSSLNQELSALLLSYVVSSLFFLLWTLAVVAATDGFVRGEELRLGAAYGRALRRYWSVLLASVVLLIALVLLVAVGVVLFVLTGFGIVGSLVAVIALVVWWLRPGARKAWVKWLIVLTAPFGLPTYVIGRWSMYIPAAVLEQRGPLAALRRSAEVVNGNWWRVVSILTVASLIVAILQWAPTTLIEVPLTVTTASRGQIGLAPTETAIINAVGVVLQILFASIGSIVYTLVFIDLRNRREGADILERLTRFEPEPTLANG
jgi:hypothetical protein